MNEYDPINNAFTINNRVMESQAREGGEGGTRGRVRAVMMLSR